MAGNQKLHVLFGTLYKRGNTYEYEYVGSTVVSVSCFSFRIKPNRFLTDTVILLFGFMILSLSHLRIACTHLNTYPCIIITYIRSAYLHPIWPSSHSIQWKSCDPHLCFSLGEAHQSPYVQVNTKFTSFFSSPRALNFQFLDKENESGTEDSVQSVFWSFVCFNTDGWVFFKGFYPAVFLDPNSHSLCRINFYSQVSLYLLPSGNTPFDKVFRVVAYIPDIGTTVNVFTLVRRSIVNFLYYIFYLESS